jgi:hypothetical protein
MGVALEDGERSWSSGSDLYHSSFDICLGVIRIAMLSFWVVANN